MNMEARVGVVLEGGQRALNSASSHGSIVDSGSRKFLQQHNNKQSQQHSQLGTVQQLLAGGIAGAFSKTCTAPLARLTILFQVQGMHSDVTALSKASIWQEASRVINEEGFRAFWKGNLVTIAHRLPYSSVSFYAYERYKSFLQPLLGVENHRENGTADLAVHFIGGGMAGITAASATYPLDLVRTRIAAQRNTMYYRGIWHAFHTICREEGFLGLYKGLGATLLGVGPSIAISFSVYESLRSFWHSKRPSDSTIMVSLACGSLSGIASSTATFPLDLVRRRMQLEGAGGRARVYTSGLFGTFAHIIHTEGFRGMYRGILPEYYKVVPSVGIVFMTYETLKMLLSRIPAS
ncbi:mitochondrial substrate carrier family protein B-like [Populus alba x Populus x berolinensis]|uniref:Mitochondrial substrate carrier family protein B-like n=1 Tax=Populus alba x Populus x berolinensis TaxID=444605 RepID=A0AAD6PUY4_9ROSI|nr:mitochondrial substrate carrier family protein B-like [Populus alba x Populus x berolinensis]